MKARGQDMMARQLNVAVFRWSYFRTLWWGVTCWCSGRGQGQELVAGLREEVAAA